MSQLSTRHLTGIRGLTRNDLDLIFQTAEGFKEVINRPIKKVHSLREPACLLNWQRND
jgi:aspartate carbamoyltransferase catalytic subunit